MAERLSRRGPTAGQRYWGCTRDPECLGRRSIGDAVAATAAAATPPAAAVRTPSSPASTPPAAATPPGSSSPIPSMRAAAPPPPPTAGGATDLTDPTGPGDRPQPTVAARSSPRPQPRTAEAAGDSIRRPPTFGAPAAGPATHSWWPPSALVLGIGLALIGMVLVFAAAALLPPDANGQLRILGGVILGAGIVIALAGSLLPQGARALGLGGDGELLTGRTLDPLTDEGWRVLHRRRMPASQEHIDQLVVGPGGIFTVASITAPGQLAIRGHDVYLNGRRRTGLIELARRQASAAVAALREAGYADNAVAVLCVHRATLPVFGSALDGVAIVDSQGLVRRLKGEPRKLDATRVALLADALDKALPPDETPATA